MFQISINGPDNVGKTTHIRLLRSACPEIADLGGIHRYGTWPNVEPSSFSDWWFKHSTPNELVRTVLSAFIARNEAAKASPGVVVLDRGIHQFEAVLTASIVIKEGVTVGRARQIAHELAADLLVNVAEESVRVILTHGADAEASVALSLEREVHAAETYRLYQRVLQSVLFEQIAAGDYDVVIDCTNRSLLEIQNEIRAALSVRGLSIPPFLGTVRVVYAFGGLSESGKSTSAQYLSRKHGVARLKISYFLELAALRHSISDIYAIPEPEQAELLAAELDLFAAKHHYIADLSVESLHRITMTEHLKRVLGAKLIIAYCEASRDNRLQREGAHADRLSEKDSVKMSRGADQIKNMCDIVVNNDGTILHLHRQLDSIHCKATMPPIRPHVKTLDASDLPSVYRETAAALMSRLVAKVGAHLALFAIVGSWARCAGNAGVSDLDVLAVVDASAASEVREALELSTYEVKVGLSLVTTEEVARLSVDSKTMHALRLITSGAISVQFLRTDYVMPSIARDYDRDDSLAYLPSVVQRLRREMCKGKPDSREIGKVCLLIGKIVLRAHGLEVENRDAAFKQLSSLSPSEVGSGFSTLAIAADSALGSPASEEILAASARFLRWVDTFCLPAADAFSGSLS